MEIAQFAELKTGVPFRGRTYFCSLELALELIGSKWKMMLLYHLRQGPLRSSELQRRMRDISGKMFTQTARALEREGLVAREVFPVVPPRVEYSLTALGETAVPVIMQVGHWGEAVAAMTASEENGGKENDRC